MSRLALVQVQQAAWALKNFGPQEPWSALLGMGEEYGEACAAMADRENYLDAVADFSIYLIHYCSMKGWDVALLWAAREVHQPTGRPWPELLGRLMHHELKSRQRIRGTVQEHDAAGRAVVSALFKYLELHCALMHEEYIKVVWRTWQQVRKRDWNKQREERPT